jgi:hypothetical protein
VQPGGVPGPVDPYVLYLGGNAGDGDNEIAMAWGVPLLLDGGGPVPLDGLGPHIHYTYTLGTVPEPGTLSLLSMGAIGLLGLRRRRK